MNEENRILFLRKELEKYSIEYYVYDLSIQVFRIKNMIV